MNATARKLTAKVVLDQDVESPMENDGAWTLYSFGRRHVNYKNPEALGLGPLGKDGLPKVTNPGLRRKLETGLAFFASYYEHGNCVWSLLDAGPKCPWDSVRVAGLVVWEHKPKGMGARTREDRAKDAATFLEEYTLWSNGDCFAYILEDEEGVLVDSCGGFIGTDYLLSALLEEHAEDEVTFRGAKHLQAEYDAKRAARAMKGK